MYCFNLVLLSYIEQQNEEMKKDSHLRDLDYWKPNIHVYKFVLVIVWTRVQLTINSPEDHVVQSLFSECNYNSIEYALIELANQLCESFNENKFTIDVFFDLSKAFYTVNNKILLEKQRIHTGVTHF